MEERAARLHTLSINHASANQNDSTLEQEQQKTYVIDTNVLIHDPNSLLNFEEHRVVIPMTVLEELDKLKSGSKSHTAADCRAAIRQIDRVLKSRGYLLSAAQKEEILRKEDVVVGGKWAVVLQPTLVWVAPYRHATMPKTFKERCRRARVPAKIRPYLFLTGGLEVLLSALAARRSS